MPPPRSAAAAASLQRILVAAATNQAVDNVLLGLRAGGFGDFARVGSVRKVAPPLLDRVLPASRSAQSVGAALGDLQAIYAEALAQTRPRDGGGGAGGGLSSSSSSPVPVEHETDVDEKHAVAGASIKKFLFQQFAQAAPECPFIQPAILREVLA